MNNTIVSTIDDSKALLDVKNATTSMIVNKCH